MCKLGFASCNTFMLFFLFLEFLMNFDHLKTKMPLATEMVLIVLRAN